MLPNRSILIWQKSVENAKIKKLKCDILSHFQTMCCGVTQIKSVGQFRKWFIALKLCLWMEVWMACLEANNVDWHTCHQQLIACSLSATITHLSIGNWTKVYTRVLLETERFTLMKCEIPNYHLSFTQIKPIENRWLPLEVENFLACRLKNCNNF